MTLEAIPQPTSPQPVIKNKKVRTFRGDEWIKYQNQSGHYEIVFAQFSELVNPTTARVYWTDNKNRYQQDNVPLANIHKVNNNDLQEYISSLKKQIADGNEWKNRFENAAKRIGMHIIESGLEELITPQKNNCCGSKGKYHEA
jgi:hypothetical protein